jgi:hypothetical protein
MLSIFSDSGVIKQIVEAGMLLRIESREIISSSFKEFL